MKKLFVGLLVALLVVSAFASTVLAEPKEKEPIDSVTLIHYIDGRVKLVGGGSCSKLLGVKWGANPSISYVINPTNGPSDTKFITTAISAATETWDDATITTSLFGGYTTGNVEWGVADKKNAYVFDSYPNNGVIAVTRYWYTKSSKQLVEYDVLFNTYYSWLDCDKQTCNSGNRGMDLQTIALHETGHGVGLADVYNRACSDVVMYGYGDYGEVKRALAPPDIAGLKTMYGI